MVLLFGHLITYDPGLKSVTRQPPSAANRMPRINCQRSELKPPAGGCITIAAIALTIGAPANMIDMTTLGIPLAPNANKTQNAPTAPTRPARVDQSIPFAGKLHDAPWAINMAAGANTAIKK